ncbi:3-phosphoshikimate 1-carboxyvinyltransferase, partial [Erwinia amylovora]
KTVPVGARTEATTGLCEQGHTVMRNIYNWRVKESEREAEMATDLSKVGAEVEEGFDFSRITTPAKIACAQIATYKDHRMAMCFPLVALSSTPGAILDPNCTAKTFPDYFT